MNWIPRIFRRRKLFNDLSEEMCLHLEERVEQLIARRPQPPGSRTASPHRFRQSNRG